MQKSCQGYILCDDMRLTFNSWGQTLIDNKEIIKDEDKDKGEFQETQICGGCNAYIELWKVKEKYTIYDALRNCFIKVKQPNL